MLHVVLEFLLQFVSSLVLIFLAQDDSSLDNHATHGVGHTGHGTLHDSRMGHEGALHLKRANAVARTLDDVVGTAHKPVVAVLVAPCKVTGVIHSVVPSLAGQFLIAIVALEESDGLLVTGIHTDLTFLTVLAGRAVGLDQADVVLRIGLSHAAGLRLCPGEGA